MTQTEQNRQPFQVRWLIVAVVVVLALIFLIPFIKEGGARVDTSVMVDTQKAFVGPIRETVSAQGEIADAETTEQTTLYPGKISDIFVQDGDTVKSGDPIAAYDPEDLEARMNRLLDQLDELDRQIEEADNHGTVELTAQSDGMVKEILVARGDDLEVLGLSDSPILTLSSDGSMAAVFPLPQEEEEEAPEVGDTLRLYIAEKAATGTVESIEEESGTMTVTFVDRPEYLPGMEVSAESREGTSLGEAKMFIHAPLTLEAQEGILSQICVHVGDRVQEGEVLLRLLKPELNQLYLDLIAQREEWIQQFYGLQNFRNEPVVRAVCGGTVDQLSIEVGGEVEAEQTVCQLVSSSNFFVSMPLTAEAARRVQPGMEAEITFLDWYSDELIAEVETVDRDEETACIALAGGEGLELGKQGQVTVILDSEEEALLVPVQAVEWNGQGEAQVTVSYGDGLTRTVPVEIGLRSGDFVEITKGIYEGDDVVVDSWVVETRIFTLFNHEWVLGQEQSKSASESESE